MSNKSQRWGSGTFNTYEQENLHLRTSITAELPETRVFIGQLYREFTDNGKRAEIASLVERRMDLPWPISEVTERVRS